MRRVIRKSSRYCDLHAADLLQSLFAVECAAPSRTLWLVSAWISDIPILDNTSDGFRGIDAGWGQRSIRLSELLVFLARRGTHVVVVTNGDVHNVSFMQRVKTQATEQGVGDLLQTSQQEDLHAKGMLGDGYYLHGSMNITHNGVHVLAEDLALELDADLVERTRLEYLEWYPLLETFNNEYRDLLYVS